MITRRRGVFSVHRWFLQGCAAVFGLAASLPLARGASVPITGLTNEGNQLLAVSAGGVTYGQNRLLGGTVTAFAAATPAVVLVPNGSPAPSAVQRSSLLGDWLLDSGLINPANGGASVTVSFPQPIVNQEGPDLVFLEIHASSPPDAMQVTVNGVAQQVAASAWGRTGYTTTSADIYNTSSTVATLAALQSSSLTLTTTDVSQTVFGIALDLSDFGVAPGASVSSISFGSSTSTSTFDPVFVAGIIAPPEITGGPVISEFLAENGDSMEDEDGDRGDWIEIYNGQNTQADLSGWALTDSIIAPTKWTFPADTVLAPFEYRVVYASGKNRPSPLLHTGFRLAKEGGYLALVRPDGSTASVFNYGPQSEDVSYGLKGAALTYGYLASPSPGHANAGTQAPNGPAEDVIFTRDSGVLTAAATLDVLPPSAPDAVIRYTTDLTEPTDASPVWPGPQTIASATTIRARVFRPGYLPGDICNRHFIFMAADLAASYRGTGQPFRSTLPVLVMESFGANIDGNTSQTAPYRTTLTAIYDVDGTGQASLAAAPALLQRGGVHVRGQSSAGFPQRQYRWELWKAKQDKDAAVPLLGMPADGDWVLHAPWNDKTLIRNAFSYELARDWAGSNGGMRTRFVEVFFNQNGGSLDFSDYRGVYVLTERIERGKDRIDVEKLNPQMTDPAVITGGFVFSKDKEPRDNPINTVTSSAWGSQPLDVFEPGQPTSAQLNFLRDHMNGFEAALSSPSFADPATGYAAFIEPKSFMDWHLIAETARQVDAFQNSNYFHKPRGGRVKALPMWDFNLAWGLTTDDGSNGSRQPGQQPSEGWHWIRLFDDWLSQKGPSHYPWFPRLFADPEFLRGYWDRYWEKRRTILTPESISSRMDRLAAQVTGGLATPVTNGSGTWPNSTPSVESPAGRHFSRWQILGTYVWTNPTGFSERTTHSSEVDYMKRWLLQRLEWMDAVSMATTPTSSAASIESIVPRPPELTPMGGHLAAGGSVTFTNPNALGGTVLYTINGSDPREPGGATHPNAIAAPAAQVSGTDLVPLGATWKFLAPASAPAPTWKDDGFNDSGWSNITSPRDAAQTGTAYFRRTFDVQGAANLSGVLFDLLVDDGAVVWLNGMELRRVGVPYPPTPVTHSTPATALMDKARELEWVSFIAPPTAVREGSNTLAVEVHQYNYAPNPTIPLNTDLSFELRVRGLTKNAGTPLTFTGSGAHTIRARVKNGSQWSPLAEVTFVSSAVPASAANLAVTELMYHPADPTPAERAAGFTDPELFEFIELQNIGTQGIDLTGVTLADAVTFDFSVAPPAARILSPGQRVLVVKHEGAFAFRYPGVSAALAGAYTGNFSNSGETVTILDASGGIIRRFSYGDIEPWSTDADGGGASLVLNSAALDPAVAANWHASAANGGLPGAPDHSPLPVNPLADTDGDGLSDLLEYAMGTDSLPSVSIEPHTSPGGVSEKHVFFRFTRNLAAGNVSWSPESSTDLLSWTSSQLSYVSTTRHADGTATVVYRSNEPADQLGPQFHIRLKVRH